MNASDVNNIICVKLKSMTSGKSIPSVDGHQLSLLSGKRSRLEVDMALSELLVMFTVEAFNEI